MNNEHYPILCTVCYVNSAIWPSRKQIVNLCNKCHKYIYRIECTIIHKGNMNEEFENTTAPKILRRIN